VRILKEKLSGYDAPQKAMQAGIYPYFRAIESEQDTVVIINGKKVLMFGSNSYLGLTNHPKVKENWKKNLHTSLKRMELYATALVFRLTSVLYRCLPVAMIIFCLTSLIMLQ
jgi:7-keto-8-aminopelargonate synthetase-like enzyme